MKKTNLIHRDVAYNRFASVLVEELFAVFNGKMAGFSFDEAPQIRKEFGSKEIIYAEKHLSGWRWSMCI